MLGTQGPAEELAALRCGRFQSGGSLKDYSSNTVLSYYENKFTGCCFSGGVYTNQHNALHLSSENSSLQKGFVFLILFDTYNNPARQIRSLLYSWSTQTRRGHITFSTWLASPGVLWSSPAPNLSFLQEKSEAFLINNSRRKVPYLSKATSKGTVDPRFYNMTIKCHSTQMRKWIKSRWDCSIPPPTGFTGCWPSDSIRKQRCHRGERSLGLNQETYTCCHGNLPNWIFKRQ